MNVLITGAAGFMGSFLAKQVLAAGASVKGIGITVPGEEWPESASFDHCDVRNYAALLQVVSRFRPERIFHLAAQSYPTVSLEKPYETMDTNAGGTINLFESLRAAGLTSMVVVACSSAEYGPVESKDLPVREDHALRPLHPYGVSKVAQDLLAAQYFANYRMPTVRIRIFNTTGPSKLGDVCSDFARRAIEIEMGLQPPVFLTGNLTSRRAIIDVRDMVRGLWLASERCEPGEVYNVGATAIYAVEELIDVIRRNVKTPFTVQPDPALMRPCDELVIAGDISKFKRCSGWKPEIDLAGTIEDMLAWWRKKLAATTAETRTEAAVS